MDNRAKHYLFSAVFLFGLNSAFGQSVPSDVENIPYLVTFGKEASKSWGDDDFCQIFFFKVPEDYKDPIYIRVFDPGSGGKHDEKKGVYDSKTKFSIYGGIGTLAPDAKLPDPVGNYKAGNLLDTKTFSDEYDDQWYTFGPFNPTSGFLSTNFGGYVLKVICEGISGDDGNLYRYFLSSRPDENIAVEGGNAFCYEYTFRIHNDPNEVAHIYPYIDSATISVKQGNFDWDLDGDIFYVSRVSRGTHMKKSGNAIWAKSQHEIKPPEKESSLDIQFHKDVEQRAKNNNVSFYITNQYDQGVAFFTVPIGGVPKYQAGKIKLINKKE